MQVRIMPRTVGFKNKFKNCDWIYQEKIPCVKIPYDSQATALEILSTFVQFQPEILCYSVMHFM